MAGATTVRQAGQAVKLDDTPAIVFRVFAFRGESVMLDSDLAGLYGVTTAAFNQAIKRNQHR